MGSVMMTTVLSVAALTIVKAGQLVAHRKLQLFECFPYNCKSIQILS